MSNNKATPPEEVQLPPASAPELIPPPEVTNNTPGNGYQKARENIIPQDVSLIENFIGGIYGEAKRIENANIGDNKFTKALKMDAAQEIIKVRQQATGVQPTTQPSKPIPLPSVPNQQINNPPSPSHVIPEHQHMIPQPQVPSSDSLILKHEIDQMKEQLKDIKRLYDEFFKLKQVKGHWKITTPEKTQSATTISKTWNVINKLLKSKAASINIEYVEDE